VAAKQRRFSRVVLGAASLRVLSGFILSDAIPSDAWSADWSWKRTDASVALLHGKTTVWQFNYGRDLDVPHFHPLSTVAGQLLSQDRPPDHIWHHGLWFSWKFINGVNYWELNQETRRPDGHTSWSQPLVQTRDDQVAVIAMQLDYRPRLGDSQPELSEQRRIKVSAPDAHGQYRIDWTSSFTAAHRVVLDRTPPQEQSWGGYAGLSLRFAEHFADRRAVSSEGLAEFGEGDRHRSRAAAMDCSGLIDGHAVGVAFLDHADNPRHPTPWYLIRSPQMSYMNAALLADEPLTLEPGDQLTLRYRVIVHAHRWDAANLREAQAEFSTVERAQPIPLPE
jgi:hypothetical protein